MNIFIKAFGKTLSFQVEPDDTVISLKQKLLDKTGVDLLKLFKYPRNKTKYDLIHLQIP